MRCARSSSVSGKYRVRIHFRERLNRYTEFRMVGEDHVGGLSLFDQRSDNRINVVHFGSGFINTSPGRGREFFVMALGSMSIVIILGW
ncbi:MAG: hypothetical protein ACLRQV_01720 [Hungatella sp.]|nr:MULTISPECIES: hypothetical protein [Hungatella]